LETRELLNAGFTYCDRRQGRISGKHKFRITLHMCVRKLFVLFCFDLLLLRARLRCR